MNPANVESEALIDRYVAKVEAGLNRLDQHRRLEILAEIRSHLTDRAEQLKQQGSQRPAEDALSAMGNADDISAQFTEAALLRTSSRSNLPWVLLRAASRLTSTGLRGSLVFVGALMGYGLAFTFTVAAVAKLIVPDRIGFWLGPNLSLIWGYSPNPSEARELVGPWFAYISIALAFLFASGTTLLLKNLLRSWKPGAALRTAHS